MGEMPNSSRKRLSMLYLVWWASLAAQTVKNLLAVQETWVPSLGQEDPLEKGVAAHFSILAWKIPGQWSLAGYSPWGPKELDMTAIIACKGKITCS